MKLASRIRYFGRFYRTRIVILHIFLTRQNIFEQPWGFLNTVFKYLLQYILVRIRIISALFPFSQHLYEKREGSGAGSWSVPLTNGSGSRRPKNLRILRIQIPKTDILKIEYLPLFSKYCIVVFAWTFPRSFDLRVHAEWRLPISGVHPIMMEKSALACEGRGCTPIPFTIVTITYKVVVYAPAEWADTLTLFHLCQYMYSVVLTGTVL